MLRLVPEDTKIDFVGKRWWAFGFTLFLMVVTVISLFISGLNLGIDFKGGILVEAKAPHVIDVGVLRSDLTALHLGEVMLQSFDDGTGVMIRLQRQEGGEEEQQRAVQLVREKMGQGYDYRRVEVVGPTVGRELFHAGLMATFFAVLAIGAYVAMRFEWQFGIAIFLATLHDVLVTIGLYSVLQLDFNLTSVAALLTLAGYSTNDTVVVFDRIREMLRRQKTDDLSKTINMAVNQTLSRTVMTGVTTMIALLPLLVFGGETLWNFSLALCWGITVGTFSSVYVAASMLLYMPPLRRVEQGKLAKKTA
ncbi:MAG: protein translocase subunit SecF [Alphaproteobacteria bacterium]|nr:protein translocase subunit SecF [Alphaproteobacteria bacterium]